MYALKTEWNIAKSFYVGYLRSKIIGVFLANLYKACFEKYGSQAELEKDTIEHLFDIYVAINKDAETDPAVKPYTAQWFKRMEDGDEDALHNWLVWREMSVRKYKKEYERPNVKSDVYTGESRVGKEAMDRALETLESMDLILESDGVKLVELEKWKLGKAVVGESRVGKEAMDRALETLESMDLILESDGVKLVELEKWKLGKAVVGKKDGTPIYLTRDIGGVIEQYERYKFNKMIYVVSSQQDLHLTQFFKVLELMGFP
ncbi:hypothetical protein CVT25_010252 [Psilocybe cyanescens]|uniref:Arginyl-tRNA synthetase catalytic core domain-containing protein n=1 Tax=Psilocybe cyanescens TaxID=93625 RepID=A0A409XDH9_PSICY|nr:hypothetical protein CVT25_010252 [Psilocybe cyanescens]